MSNTINTCGCGTWLIVLCVVAALFQLIHDYYLEIFILLGILLILYLVYSSIKNKKNNQLDSDTNCSIKKYEYDLNSHSLEPDIVTPNLKILLNRDAYFVPVARFIIDRKKVSIGMIQRMFNIDYHRSVIIVEQLCAAGIVSSEDKKNLRHVLVTLDEFEKYVKLLPDIPDSEEVIDYQIEELPINHIPNYDNMDGHEFEYFCADLLKNNGFNGVEVTKGSGDQGIDILAQKDGIKYGIQCKCYSSDIGNKAVQEAFAGKTFYHCHVAAVLTNRYFTASAKELAEINQVLLWDRDFLNNLIENKQN